MTRKQHTKAIRERYYHVSDLTLRDVAREYFDGISFWNMYRNSSYWVDRKFWGFIENLTDLEYELLRKL